MAQRRMFSSNIVDSDAYLDMPQSSQLLYFHLGMRADDDGFVNPKKVMRLIGAGEDDLKVLLAKRFLLPFETGVVVIKHWLIHNLIRKDRYKETMYVEEKSRLFIKQNKAYTEMATKGLPSGNQMAPQVRLGKVRLGKVSKKIAAQSAAAPKKKKGDEEDPMTLKQFLLWCRPSDQRHIRIIAEYADEKKPDFKTKGQWREFIKRNVRPAQALSPYTDEQISQAMTKVEEVRKSDRNINGYLTKWTLETLTKFLE